MSFVIVAWVWSLLWLSVMAQTTKRWSKIRVGPFTCGKKPCRFFVLSPCTCVTELTRSLFSPLPFQILFPQSCCSARVALLFPASREYSIYKKSCKLKCQYFKQFIHKILMYISLSWKPCMKARSLLANIYNWSFSCFGVHKLWLLVWESVIAELPLRVLLLQNC